jgi:hypothetical protein
MSQGPLHSRRSFLGLLPVALIAFSGGRGWAAAPSSMVPRQKHPKPRSGIDASRVVAAKDLEGDKDVIEAFDLVREIPQVVDGIRCSCGCDTIDGYYSLLSCFEQDGMARHCEVCRGHARLVHRLHRKGRTLAQIRAAVDAESH